MTTPANLKSIPYLRYSGPALLAAALLFQVLAPRSGFDTAPWALIAVMLASFQMGLGPALALGAVSLVQPLLFSRGEALTLHLGALGTAAALGAWMASWMRTQIRRSTAETRAAREIIDEMTHEHWTLLSVTTRALASSLDYKGTLQKVALLSVPDLADACLVHLTEENGSTTRVSHGALPKDEHFQEELSAPMLEVIRTSKPARLGSGTMIMPLRSRDLTLGAMTFISRKPGFSYSHSHERLAEQIASRAALAIDNARLYEKAQKEIQAREKILALISHDLKNPLFAVDVSAQILLKSPRVAAEATSRERMLLEEIRHATKRMDLLIRDLLDAAKLRSGTFHIVKKPESLLGVLGSYADFARTLALSKGIEILLEQPEKDSKILVDSERMFRVFSNIIGNAIKFTPNAGKIRIRVVPGEKEAVFSVSDSGSGIAKEDLAHVFVDFWQAKDTAKLGTGLGMPIAKGIVEAHGGRIWAESPAGEGATFYFSVGLA